MNNVLESIEYFRKAKDYAEREYYEPKRDTEIITNLFNTAIKSLEKQIPRKPLEQQLNINKDLIGLCPICMEMWVIKYKGYCANCGQKLDWRD